MKHLVIFIHCCFLLLNLKGQSKPLTAFILPGHVMMDTASGDLTGDGKRDIVLLLKSKNETEDREALRPLLLLKGDGKGGYALIARNDHVALCAGCGGVMGDPYQQLVVKGRYFSVEHYGGSRERWTRTITFRFDKKKSIFLLHRDAGETFDATEENKIFKPVLYREQDFGKLAFTSYSTEAAWQ